MPETRLLIVISKPIDMGPLDPDDKEKRAIEQSLNKYGPSPISYDFLLNPTPPDLLAQIDDFRPEIVHFISHGNQDTEIVLTDSAGKGKPVTHEALKALFQSKMVRMVLMNACYSIEQANIIRSVVDCVIGMNAPISNQAATVFATEFYRNVGKGDSVKAAFKDAQRALDLDDNSDKVVPEIQFRRGVDGDELIFVNKTMPHQPDPVTLTQTGKPIVAPTTPTETKEEQPIKENKSPDQPVEPQPSLWGRIPIPIWTLIITGIFGLMTAIITNLGPQIIEVLYKPTPTTTPTEVAQVAPTSTTYPTPTPAATIVIQSIVKQSLLSLEDVLAIQQYLLSSAEPEEDKWPIIRELGKANWTNAVPVLQEIIRNSNDTTTKQEAVTSLSKIGPSAQLVLLWALDKDPNDYILRQNVINALGNLPDENNLAIFSLRSILLKKNEPEIVLKESVKTLGKLNAVIALDEIVALLRNGEQIVRTQAAETLSRFDFPQVKEALRHTVESDPVIDTRLVAIHSLITLEDKEAILLFEQLNESEESDTIRTAAKDAYYRLTGQSIGVIDSTSAPQPTSTGEESISALSLQEGVTGTAQSELHVQFNDDPIDASVTYESGTQIEFVRVSADTNDLVLVRLPDGKQGWVNVSAISWFSSTKDAPSNILWPNGKVIKILFLDGEREIQDKVEKYAQEWTEYANLTFDFGEHQDAEVRITFEGDGAWSYVGTINQTISRFKKPTMSLGMLHINSSNAEIKRVVLHEFGYVIGLLGENGNPNNTIPWNKEKVYEYYSQTAGWTKDQTDYAVFRQWLPSTYQVEKAFDPDSIMTHPVSKDLTYDNYEISAKWDLSLGDKAFAAMLYPKPATVTDSRASTHYTWFGNISPAVVGIAGSAADTFAMELMVDNQQHGAFSGTFLPILRDNKADLNEDGLVSLDEAVLMTGVGLRKNGSSQSPLIVGKDTDFALFSLQPNTTPLLPIKRLEVLLVGINDYESLSPDLRGPLNDVKLFETLLQEKEYVIADEVHITLLTDQEATESNIKSALTTLITEADSSTAILFYFAGISTVTESQRSPSTREKAIVPFDASDAKGYLSVPELASLLETSKAKYKILIID